MSVTVSGCVTPGDFCDVAKPFRPSPEDRLTDGSKQQVVSHNEYGAKACGWKPR